MTRWILLSLLALTACGDKETETGSEADTDTDSDTDADTDTDTDTDADTDTFSFDCGEHSSTDQCTSWVTNTDGEASALLVDLSTGDPIPVNITEIAVDGSALVISSYGIPNYSYTLSQDDISELNSRPNAETDFASGQTTASAGDTVAFGTDIGFNSSTPTPCDTGKGYGWWPPGPECPDAVFKTMYVPLSPAPAASGSECETGLGLTGMWVNGVSIFNWGDGFTYDTDGNWRNLAGAQEVFDLDICAGHAAAGEYHHHGYSKCLADALGDTGTGHSPIYGWAADGYPIHGPHHASGVEAESCWVQRDYDDASDPLGCGGTGERTCQLVDPFDPAKGTTTVSTSGPDTSDTVTSLSGNIFPGTDGLYYEDFYYQPDCSSQGDQYLDEHNGHDHDGYGYHYHVTGSFPYTMGPTLYGEVPDENDIRCDGVSGGGLPPG